MNYHNIKHDDMLNGDGIRTTLFVSGCTHGCNGCHNPQTWDKNSGILFDQAAKDEIFETLKSKYVSGVTFSGGDPMAPFNRQTVLAFMEEIKENFPDKNIWMYTGFTKEQLMEDKETWDKVSSLVDVIVDGRFELEKRDVSYHWAGSTNQRVLRKENDFEMDIQQEMELD